jgi:hypothetical protein
MKFKLFVEGYTEQKAIPAFLKRWLDVHLEKRVGIQAVRFEGWQELVKDTPLKARMYLEGPDKKDIIGVIALLDLYGPTFYPKDKTTALERYHWAKEELERQVAHPKFRQFFAIHEVEAWLLSEPNLFIPKIKNALPNKPPEEINFHEPPAKLLERLYKQHTKHRYKKVTYGRELFSQLDPNQACSKCPRLKEMLEEMLKMAS